VETRIYVAPLLSKCLPSPCGRGLRGGGLTYYKKIFDRLINNGLLTKKKLDEVMYEYESETSGKYAEELLIQRGIPKHEILFCLSEYYIQYPFVEYNESIVVPGCPVPE
jgi:hypothetical protein